MTKLLTLLGVVGMAIAATAQTAQFPNINVRTNASVGSALTADTVAATNGLTSAAGARVTGVITNIGSTIITNSAAGTTPLTINHASGATAHLQDWNKGGVSQLYLDANGNFSALSTLANFIGLTDSSSIVLGSANDLWLRRDAANTLALRNGVNAQAFNIYGTYTDASNYRRGRVTVSTAGVLTLGAEGLGTGATGNSIALATDGTTKLTITNGNVSVTGSMQVTGNMSLSGTFSEMSAAYYVAGANDKYGFNGRTQIKSPSNGDLQFLTAAENGVGKLIFGPATASFPSLKRSTTNLVARLADDSADTDFQASHFIVSGTTNQILFGSTNTAPVSAVAPTKWISVQVAGESTVYRLPLYE